MEMMSAGERLIAGLLLLVTIVLTVTLVAGGKFEEERLLRVRQTECGCP
jgi:hypothetical protein